MEELDSALHIRRRQGRLFRGRDARIAVAGADLLEIGFGAGDFLAWARSQGARVAGTEVNDVLLAAARERDIETVPAALETVADKNAGRFDTIVAFDVFEHLDLVDIRTALSACAVMLKPGGHLVLRFPNAQSPFGLAPQNGDITHKTRLSRSVFEQIVDVRQFSIVRYGGAYRFVGRAITRKIARTLRAIAQDAISAALNAVYAQDIPWDPVVVIVLRKAGSSS